MRFALFLRAGLLPVFLVALTLTAPVYAQEKTARLQYIKAFVMDDRLSTLRREPDMQSEVVQRLRVGRPVYIIGSRRARAGDPLFYRVAVTRRTRGWIHEAALVIANRTGDAERIIAVAETTKDSVERIALCRLLIQNFSRSALVPRALLMIAKEADRAAQLLSRRAGKRLQDHKSAHTGVRARDLYLNDPALDRYSRLRIRFNFNDETNKYVYDGQAYRELIKRFPNSEEAKTALKHLDRAQQKLATR